MPILWFEKKEDFISWIKKETTPEKYAAIITRDGEVIMQPTKSTRPLYFGYLKAGDEDMRYVIENLKTEGYTIYPLKRYQWDAERSPMIQLKEGEV